MRTKAETSSPTVIDDPRPFKLGRISAADQTRWESFSERQDGFYDYDNVLRAWADPRVTSPHLRERMVMLITAPMGAFMKYPHGRSTDCVGREKYVFIYNDPEDSSLPQDLGALVADQPQLASELALAMIAWRKVPLLKWNDYDREAYNEILATIEPVLATHDPKLVDRLPFAALIGDTLPRDVHQVDPEKEAKLRVRRLTLPEGAGGTILLDIDDRMEESSEYTDEISELVTKLFAEIDAKQSEDDRRDAQIRKDSLVDITLYASRLAKSPNPSPELLNRLLRELIAREDKGEFINRLGSVMNDDDTYTDVAIAATDGEVKAHLLAKHFTPNAFPVSRGERIYMATIVNDTARSAVAWLSDYYADSKDKQARTIVETCRSILTEYDIKAAAKRHRQQQWHMAKVAARETLISVAA